MTRMKLGPLLGLLVALPAPAPHGAFAAEPAPKAAFAPWIVARPDDPRAASLPSLPKAPLSPNAPGILVTLAASTFADASLPTRLESLFLAAHGAGRRAGLALELPEVSVTPEARQNEATSAETLYPGLGRILRSAVPFADLVELDFPDLGTDLRARSFVLKKLAAEVRSLGPATQIAVVFRETASGALFPSRASEILSEVNAAYVDLIGLELAGPAMPERLREAADRLAFGRPLLVRGAALPDVDALLGFASRFAPADAPVVAAPVEAPPAGDAALDRLARLLDGDFGRDARTASARRAAGAELAPFRLVSGVDLGGVVLVPAVDQAGAPARGPFTLTLDGPGYASAEVTELATGRSRSFEIPRTKDAPPLSLSTANGSIAVRLTAREKAPAELTKARVGVSATRGLTVEEILAKHQAWRAKRDARWSRFIAKNSTSVRLRFADVNNTLDLTLAGPFFYELGKGYDWAWSEAYFNGVRWRGKKIPELPLLQPEKVSELPLALTFNDSYRYLLAGEEAANGVRCYAVDFSPTATESDKPLYAGKVHISTSDFSVVKTETHQLNLAGEVQSVDESTDFTEVPAPDGGEPLRFPTRTRGQWILRTFSRTTVLERETGLSEVRLDPPSFAEEKKAAFASKDVMVRDTEKGVRYLERTKEGDRVVVEDAKTSRLFGLGGVFYDSSQDFPLPLLGVYYLDLDFRKKHQQIQVFFGGVLLAASFNEPRLFGTKFDVGADVFGIALRGTDSIFVNGTEDETQRVKQRAFAGNLNFGHPVGRHLKLSASIGVTHRDFAAADETAPGFAVPSDHWVTHLQGRAIWDVGGWAISAQYAWNKRSAWDPWGAPGNPDYDPGKDEYRTYGVGVAKDFHLPRFQRIRTSFNYAGSSNTDRFSKYTFGFYGGTALRGFRSGSLRGDEAVIARGAYGLVLGDAIRIEGIYEHAVVKDAASGLDWASFGGAGISGQLPGPWSTILQVDAGAPVVGRNRGQRGVVLNLVFLKIF